MHIVMIGTGYVGLVTGTCLAEVGHDVVCVDLDQAKIDVLRSGRTPIYEPGLEVMIQRNIDHERLTFTTDFSEALSTAEVAFIAVGTPEGEDGSADLKYVENVADTIGKNMHRALLVVVKSTVPVGTCDQVQCLIDGKLKDRNSRFSCHVASNPEFLKEGEAVKDFLKPDRMVIGVEDHEAEKILRDLYKPFIIDDPSRLQVMDRRSSELTKYGANSMLATRISFMNELSLLCEKMGANIDHVRQGIGTDPRIGRKFLYAGPGYGGSCFPKDVSALLKSGEKYEVDLSVLQAVHRANEFQKERMTQKIIDYFGNMKGKVVAIWGLAFKPGTDDVREAPAIKVIQGLLAGGAKVIAHDPQGVKNFDREIGSAENLVYAQTSYSAIKGADALVLMTEWSEYRRPNWQKVSQLMRQKAVFDFRNQYEASELFEHEFYYECVGRPDSRRRDNSN